MRTVEQSGCNTLPDLTTPKLSGARIMADSDNTTTLPSVTPSRKSRMESAVHFANGGATNTDPALSLSQAWTEAHAAMAEQCLRQQRLETKLLECGQLHRDCPPHRLCTQAPDQCNRASGGVHAVQSTRDGNWDRGRPTWPDHVSLHSALWPQMRLKHAVSCEL